MSTIEDHEVSFLNYVIQSLVEHEGEVEIEKITDDMGVLLTVTVHKDDMGKIIGREGSTAKALRTIMRTLGLKHQARYNLKING